MDIPAPPPGFEPVGATPPPPPGFEPVQDDIPPPPKGFAAIPGILKQAGKDILNIVPSMLHLPQAAGEASERIRVQEGQPEDYGTVLGAAATGLKLGRTPGVVSAPAEVAAIKAAKPEIVVNPAPKEAPPPPPAGFEIVPASQIEILPPERRAPSATSIARPQDLAQEPPSRTGFTPRKMKQLLDEEVESLGNMWEDVHDFKNNPRSVGEMRQLYLSGAERNLKENGLLNLPSREAVIEEMRDRRLRGETPRAMGHETVTARAIEEPEIYTPPRSLSAAASGVKEPPAPVTKLEVTAVADDLNRLRGASVADRAEIGNRLEATPPGFKDPALQERLYHAIENPEEMAKLAPQERALFDQYIQPMRTELSDLYNKVKAYGGEDLVADPTYVHRIAKGHAPAYDTLSGEAANPITGTRTLNRTTSALQGRKFFALQDEGGNRFVVSEAEHGAPVVWNKGKPTQLTTLVELIPGSEVQLGGKTFDITQARTREIEANTPVEYHKSAAVNTADALVRMREVARNLEALEKFKTDLVASGRAKPLVGGKVPDGMVEAKMPQLRGTAFDPKIAAAFDDFYKPGFEGFETLRKVNQFATASIFWNPLPHIENVAMHWFTGRGFDWVRPAPMKNFVTDAGRAIKEVVEQGPEYQRLLKEGSGLVYGGVKNADFYQQMGRRFGMEIEKNWGEWKPYFDRFGLKTPYEATAWWYGKMRDVLWAANDMFMLHRVFELERKGMPVRAAIEEAELHIPNYRIPTEVLNSRLLSRVMQEPAFTIFSRYHYGQWKSYMNMISHLAKGSGKERIEALGNVAALGFLMYAVYPAIDAALQKVTGDPNAKKLRRGSTSIPDWLTEYALGNSTLAQLLGNTVTIAPATKEIGQQFTGKDWFTGQDLGTAPNRAEHAAKALVSPYNTAAQMTDERPGTRTAGRTAFDTLVGAKNTSQRTREGMQRAKMFREKADVRQAERPTGPITRGYKAAKEFIGYKGP